MNQHLDFLKVLDKTSSKIEKLSHDICSRVEKEKVSDEEIIKVMCEISDEVTTLQAVLNHQLKVVKSHK